MPRFETEKVPPSRSAGVSLLLRALAMSALDSRAIGIGIADYRHHQPGWGVDGHAHMDVLIADEMIILEGTIDLGVLFEGKGRCLHDQIIDGDLHSFFASRGIKCLAHCQDISHIDLTADIKVRYRLFRLGQAASDEHLYS